MQIQEMLSTEVKALFPGKCSIAQPHFQENIQLNIPLNFANGGWGLQIYKKKGKIFSWMNNKII